MTTDTIKIIPTKDNGIAVVSPYNSAFVAGARRLAGKWGRLAGANGAVQNAWLFPAEVASDVKALLRDVYGEDGTTAVPVVRLRVGLSPPDAYRARSVLDTGDSLHCEVAGRQVARAFDRDGGARLGDLVIIRAGGFDSDGSRKNPRLSMQRDTVVDLLRLPRPMAERLIAEHPDLCRIVADDGAELAEAPIGDNIVSLRGA